MNPTTTGLIRIAKRDNNKKRAFLLVNPIQGKHIPVIPSRVFGLVEALARQVLSAGDFDGPLFVIGFAETATALGAMLASHAPDNTPYLHTTRELLPDRHYLYFSEEHSHAAEQKLDRDFLDEHLTDGTRILFTEDEVTTGRTIENIMRVIREAYPGLMLRFSVASLLNGMDEERIRDWKDQGIGCHYLEKVPFLDYDTFLSRFRYEPSLTSSPQPSAPVTIPTITADCAQDPRRGVMAGDYNKCCLGFSESLASGIFADVPRESGILLLGTEEFMYPGLFLGRHLEHIGYGGIRFHATTRSPILPSREPDYPINRRFRLTSFYQEDRSTFVYNLNAYDRVFLLTDTPVQTTGPAELCQALTESGCGPITQILWR